MPSISIETLIAFAYRAFFAIRGLTNSKGQPTNAVYGFARVLLKLLREHDPSHIAVIFDPPDATRWMGTAMARLLGAGAGVPLAEAWGAWAPWANC